MRILHYVDENMLSWAEPWFQLLRSIEGDGVQNVILCRPGGDLARRAAENGFEVKTYRPPITALPGLCVGLRAIIREIGPDLIHTRLSSAASLAGYWAKKEGIPVLCTIDKFPKAKYYRLADLLLPCSTAVRDHMLREGFPLERMAIIPNAIQVGRYAKDIPRRESLRRKMGVAENDLVVLGAGRMVDWKGFDDLIEAFALVLQNHNEDVSLSLWLAGEGPERPGLEALARERGIAERVRFLGFVPDIRPALWASDIYIHPSWGGEAFGLILLEALASGLACIATENGGIPDFVTDGESGLLVPVRNPGQMADAISKMCQSESRSYFAGNSVRAASAFDVPVVVEKLLGIYRRFDGDGNCIDEAIC